MLFPVLPSENNTEHMGVVPYPDGFVVHKLKPVTQHLQFQLINTENSALTLSDYYLT